MDYGLWIMDYGLWIPHGKITECGEVDVGPGESSLFFLTTYHTEIPTWGRKSVVLLLHPVF